MGVFNHAYRKPLPSVNSPRAASKASCVAGGSLSSWMRAPVFSRLNSMSKRSRTLDMEILVVKVTSWPEKGVSVFVGMMMMALSVQIHLSQVI